MFNVENLFKNIVIKLSLVHVYIHYVNKCNLFDANIIAEDFFARFFSILYHKNFKNLNIDKNNAKGVDIGDNVGNITIQITSENKKQKISNTIEKYKNSEFVKKYKELQIFIITDKKPKYKENGYKIFNITTLLKEIKSSDKELQEKLNKFLDDNLNLPIFNEFKATELVNYRCIKPKNMLKFIKFLDNDTDKKTTEYLLDVFYKYLQNLEKMSTEQRIYLRLCAERFYQMKNYEDAVNYNNGVIRLSAIRDALPPNFASKYKKMVRDMAPYGLIYGDFDDMLNAEAIYFNKFDGWNIIKDVIEFAYDQNIPSKTFFDEMNFLLLDE